MHIQADPDGTRRWLREETDLARTRFRGRGVVVALATLLAALVLFGVSASTRPETQRRERESVEELLRVPALCLGNSELHRLAQPLIGDFVSAPPATIEPWATILAENSAPTSIQVPIFIGQGLADTVVRPSATTANASALCAAGVPIQYHRYRGATHLLAAYASLPEMLKWQEPSGAATSPPDARASDTLPACRPAELRNIARDAT